jgi:hypothetical protein
LQSTTVDGVSDSVDVDVDELVVVVVKSVAQFFLPSQVRKLERKK